MVHNVEVDQALEIRTQHPKYEVENLATRQVNSTLDYWTSQNTYHEAQLEFPLVAGQHFWPIPLHVIGDERCALVCRIRGWYWNTPHIRWTRVSAPLKLFLNCSSVFTYCSAAWRTSQRARTATEVIRGAFEVCRRWMTPAWWTESASYEQNPKSCDRKRPSRSLTSYRAVVQN